MGRSRNTKHLRRVQLRLSQDCAEICDQFSSEQISEVLEVAIARGIRPGQTLGQPITAVIRPEKLRTRTIARIAIVGHQQRTVQIMFPEKRDDFRDVVKQRFCYEWTGWCWSRCFEAAVVCDRVAEVAHALLLHGFAVQVDHTGVQELAIAGTFRPEARRLVSLTSSGVYSGWFAFEYPKADDLYGELMSLTAARYVDGRVRIPPEHFAEVEDFAEQNDFEFTQEAHEALEQARSLWESALLVLPKRKQKKKPQNPIDSSVVEVPDALKDDLA